MSMKNNSHYIHLWFNSNIQSNNKREFLIKMGLKWCWKHIIDRLSSDRKLF